MQNTPNALWTTISQRMFYHFGKVIAITEIVSLILDELATHTCGVLAINKRRVFFDSMPCWDFL